MTPTLIGLTGFAQSGKDSIAQVLHKLYGFERVAFADPLKELALKVNPELARFVQESGWEMAKREPIYRRLLQDLGVGAREVFGDDIWVDTAFNKIRDRGPHVVITDVRFPNEWDRVKEHHGIVVRVQRPGIEAVNSHISEHALLGYRTDYVLFNGGGMRQLSLEVIEMVEYLYTRKARRLARTRG